MLYTIAEINELIGLSKVSIYKKLKVKQLEVHLSKSKVLPILRSRGLI